jgi:hypothetical protein
LNKSKVIEDGIVLDTGCIEIQFDIKGNGLRHKAKIDAWPPKRELIALHCGQT